MDVQHPTAFSRSPSRLKRTSRLTPIAPLAPACVPSQPRLSSPPALRFLVLIAPAEEAYKAEAARKEAEDKINKAIHGDKKTN